MIEVERDGRRLRVTVARNGWVPWGLIHQQSGPVVYDALGDIPEVLRGSMASLFTAGCVLVRADTEMGDTTAVMSVRAPEANRSDEALIEKLEPVLRAAIEAHAATD